MSSNWPPMKFDKKMTDRLSIRLTPEQKALVDKAAQLTGDGDGTVDFWRELILRKADEIVQEHRGQQIKNDFMEVSMKEAANDEKS